MTEMAAHGIATIYTLRRFYILMRRTAPALPIDLIEPAEPLSHAIKGRPAPWANPEPRTLSHSLLLNGSPFYIMIY